MKVGVGCLNPECDYVKIIDEPEGGQSLYGTAGYYMARHEELCGENTTTIAHL